MRTPLASPRVTGLTTLLVVLVAGATFTAPTVARADPAAEFRFHYEQGVQHLSSGQLDRALGEFLQAQRLAPHPNTLYVIGWCFRRLGRNAEAYSFFNQFLETNGGDSTRRADAERAVAQIRGQVALISVTTTPEGARIFVDRAELGSRGTTNGVVALDPPTARQNPNRSEDVASSTSPCTDTAPDSARCLWVELDGYRASAPRWVEVAAGRTVSVDLALEQIVGRLRVQAPDAARVVIRSAGGQTVSTGAAPHECQLPPGQYQVEVSAPGHVPWLGVASVRADVDESITAHPALLPEPTAALTVTSNFDGSTVGLDRRRIGYTPLTIASARVGRHVLLVEREGLLPFRGVVDLDPARPSFVTVTLEPRNAHPRSPLTWIFGAGGLATLAAGGVVALLAESTHEDFLAAQRSGTSRNVATLRDRGESLDVAADVLLLGGSALLLVGGTLFFATGSDVPGHSHAAGATQAP